MAGSRCPAVLKPQQLCFLTRSELSSHKSNISPTACLLLPCFASNLRVVVIFRAIDDNIS